FLLGGAGAAGASIVAAEGGTPRLRAGLVTDLHYADKPAAGTRHYRETLAKLAEAGERFQKERTDLVVELGDIGDSADSVDAGAECLRRINRGFAALPVQMLYGLRNHCVHALA